MTPRYLRLWAFAEKMHWDDRWPRFFWRWLVHRLDKANQYRFDCLSEMRRKEAAE